MNKSCENCKNGIWGTSGDGYNEPYADDWECRYMYPNKSDKWEQEMNLLTELYESKFGEVDFKFAEYCPYFDQIEGSKEC